MCKVCHGGNLTLIIKIQMNAASRAQALCIYTLLFHSLEFDIEFNIANSFQDEGTASISVTFGVLL